MNYWGFFFIGACILVLAVCFYLIWRDEQKAEERERRAVEGIARLAKNEKVVFIENRRRGVR